MECGYVCRTLLFLGFLQIIHAQAIDEFAHGGPSSVYEGDEAVLECTILPLFYISWRKDGKPLDIDSRPNHDQVIKVINKPTPEGRIRSRLVIGKARPNDTGLYVCGPFASAGHYLLVRDTSAGKTTSCNYDFGNYKVFDFKKAFTLQCNITIEKQQELTYKWQKDNKDLGQPAAFKGGSIELTMSKGEEAEAGNYTLIVSQKPGDNATDIYVKFDVVMRPHVKMPANSNVVEGEKLFLPCITLGVPVPKVSWKIGNDTYEESKDRFELNPSKKNEDDKNPIVGGILHIKESKLTDAGEYVCWASSTLGNGQILNSTEPAKTILRVKDKMAALWPFLGICVEVIVLCTVILIYEKKRNKTEMEESDTDGSPEQKNTPDHNKDSDVRHRK